jgi:hypothetical protein
LIDPTTDQAVDVCEIVWWSGYVKGRFQAILNPASTSPRLVAQSAQMKWRSATPPGRTEDAVALFEDLKGRLTAAGWTVAGQSENAWYAVELTRPSLEQPVARASNGSGHVDRAPAARADTREPELLAQLRSDLHTARQEAARERERRLQAESAALQVVVPPRPAVEPPRRSPLLVAAYATVVVAAVSLFLLGFHSVYAAVVAGLTVMALALATDSMLLARHSS